VLIVAAERAFAVPNRRIAKALADAGNQRSQLIVMPTDHGFNDHRIALIDASIDWLQQIGRKP